MKKTVELKEVFFAKGKTLFPIKGQKQLMSFLEMEKAERSEKSYRRLRVLKPGIIKKKK